MTEPKQPSTGGNAGLDAQLESDASDLDLGGLPPGILDDTPLESFDEQGFLSTLGDDDERPRFGALAGPEADQPGDEMLSTEGIETAVLDAPIDMDAPLPAELAGMQLETETDATPLSDGSDSDFGLDLGLDELDLAAIEAVAEEGLDLQGLGIEAEDEAAAIAGSAAPLDFGLEDKPAAAAAEAPKLPKFMFDVSFDLPERGAVEAEPEPTPEPEPEVPPPPTFSEEELAAARQAGFADGQAAGYHDAMQSLESRISQGIDAVGMYLPSLLAERERLALALAKDAARLAHALVRRALPELNRRYGTAEIEAVVSDAIQLAVEQPRILIRVAPDLAERLTPPLEAAALAKGFSGKVTVLGDASLAAADVRIDWGDGGVDRITERVWSELTAIVARMVDGLEAETKLGGLTIESAA